MSSEGVSLFIDVDLYSVVGSREFDKVSSSTFGEERPPDEPFAILSQLDASSIADQYILPRRATNVGNELGESQLNGFAQSNASVFWHYIQMSHHTGWHHHLLAKQHSYWNINTIYTLD